MADYPAVFNQLGQILAICPECEHLFYLSEGRPYLSGKLPISIVDRLRAEEQKLDRIEERLNLAEEALRQEAAQAGLATTKAMLKKIDPVFSGAGYDPQDVKLIFNPVTYVVFHGLSRADLGKICLLAKPAEDAVTDRIHKAIDRTITRGNIDFKTLRVDDVSGLKLE